MIAFLDTHAVVALHDGRAEVFGKASRRLLTTADLRWSPAVAVELALLFEIGRVTVTSERILARVASDLGAAEADDPFGAVAARAVRLTWARDPFDRLIVAHADLHDAPLISRDGRIGEHFSRAVW